MSPTWSFENQKDVRKRPPGPVQNPKKDAISNPQGFLGISKAFGFTKRNEVRSHNNSTVHYLSSCDQSPVTLSSVKSTLVVTGISVVFDLAL